MAKATLIAALLFAATIGVIVVGIRSATRVTCTACVTYLGRTECREAAGRDETEAVRTAIDNACAFLASGMTDSVACTTRSPVTSTCRER